MNGPAAWITDESIHRLRLGGNRSRGTVPAHNKKSSVAKHPLYLKQIAFVPPKCRYLDPPIELSRQEASAYMHGWNACRAAIAKATGEAK